MNLENLNLENLNLVELNPHEVQETEGGYIWPLIVGYVIIEIGCNPTASWKAFKAGYDSI